MRGDLEDISGPVSSRLAWKTARPVRMIQVEPVALQSHAPLGTASALLWAAGEVIATLLS